MRSFPQLGLVADLTKSVERLMNKYVGYLLSFLTEPRFNMWFWNRDNGILSLFVQHRFSQNRVPRWGRSRRWVPRWLKIIRLFTPRGSNGRHPPRVIGGNGISTGQVAGTQQRVLR